jgi:hypothetical protein
MSRASDGVGKTASPSSKRFVSKYIFCATESLGFTLQGTTLETLFDTPTCLIYMSATTPQAPPSNQVQTPRKPARPGLIGLLTLSLPSSPVSFHAHVPEQVPSY